MLPFGLQSSLINRGAQALGGLFGLKPKAPPLPGQLAAIQPPAPNTFSRPPQYDRAPIQAPQRPVYGPPKPLPNAPTGGMTFKPGTAIPTGTIKPGAPSRPVVSPTGTPPAGSPTGEGQTGGQTVPPPQQPAPQQPPAFNTAAQIAALTGKQYASGQNIVADGRMQSEVQINPGEREIPLAQAQAMGLIGPASSGSTQPWKVTVEGDQVKVYQPHGVSSFGLPVDSPLRSQIAAMGGGTPVNAPPTLASQGTFLSPNQPTPVNAQVQALGIPAGAAQPGAAQPPGVPAGATLITGPSGLQGLTESQIYRDPNSKNIYKLPTAGAAGTTPAPGTTTPPPAGTTGTAGAGTTTEANPFAQTPEELKAQQQLDAIIASEKLGSVNIEDQTIPMDFITGQQAALERRAAALSEPLKTKLAAEQAKRQAALDYSKYQAEQAKTKAEAEKAQTEIAKPFEAGGQIYQYDPATKQYKSIGTAQSTAAPTASIQEYEYAKAHGYTGSFSDYQTEDANRKAKANNIKAAGLSPSLTTAALKLSDDFEGATKNYRTVTDSYNRIQAAAKDPTPAGDLSMIFAYMKLLDPTSVVREGEFATAQNTGTIPQSIWGKYNQLIGGTGRLDANLRTDFVNQANKIYQSETAQFNQTKNQYAQRARDYGIPENLVVRESGSAVGSSSSGPSYITPDGVEYQQGSDGHWYPKAKGGADAAIQSVNIGGKTVSVAPTIANKLAMADADFFRATGQHLQINEALRSHERQAKLYADYQSGKGGRAAPPGKSFHERGLAVDVANWKKAEPFLRKYGLRNDLTDDRNHFSFGETG